MLLRHPDTPCVGIDENAALVIEDGKARAVSSDGKAGVVVKRVVDGEIKVIPLTENHGAVPINKVLDGSFVGQN